MKFHEKHTMYTYIHIYIYTYIHIYTHLHMHACMVEHVHAAGADLKLRMFEACIRA